MTPLSRPQRAIDGKGRTIRELLAGHKYSIDYYQREYKWQQKQVAELIDDLTDKFLESHEEGNERSAVAEYGHYFLGSIIISDKDGQKFIIDGQQRLTTLTLLLIFLHHQLEDVEQKGQIADLVFSQKYGKRSFNLDVQERADCMDALYKGEEFAEANGPESVVNILARYDDIEELFPDELKGLTLPYFVDWLVENVHLVEITAYSDSDAYTIFETMNDRGLSLTPADMLKGYLLANITDTAKRTHASGVWKERIQALAEIGKDEDADAIKSWLRSQYAESIRERKRGAVPQDFDLVGTEFHRWVRDHEERLGLTASAEFARFIERDFSYYGRWYQRLRLAAETRTPGLECVHYNSQHNFTLQYPVLLAPLKVNDDGAGALRKIRVVATYLDILIHRRIWNWRAIDYSTMHLAGALDGDVYDSGREPPTGRRNAGQHTEGPLAVHAFADGGVAGRLVAVAGGRKRRGWGCHTWTSIRQLRDDRGGGDEWLGVRDGARGLHHRRPRVRPPGRTVRAPTPKQQGLVPSHLHPPAAARRGVSHLATRGGQARPGGHETQRAKEETAMKWNRGACPTPFYFDAPT